MAELKRAPIQIGLSVDDAVLRQEISKYEQVRDRVTEAFNEVVENNKGKKIVIVSHGTAISFLLMNWCKLLDVQQNYLRKLEFNGNVIINRPYNSPEVFKVTIDENNNIVNVENLEFESIM